MEGILHEGAVLQEGVVLNKEVALTAMEGLEEAGHLLDVGVALT